MVFMGLTLLKILAAENFADMLHSKTTMIISSRKTFLWVLFVDWCHKNLLRANLNVRIKDIGVKKLGRAVLVRLCEPRFFSHTSRLFLRSPTDGVARTFSQQISYHLMPSLLQYNFRKIDCVAVPNLCSYLPVSKLHCRAIRIEIVIASLKRLSVRVSPW